MNAKEKEREKEKDREMVTLNDFHFGVSFLSVPFFSLEISYPLF